MNKIIIFLGSPRRTGVTAQIVNEISSSAKSKGAELITYDLNNRNIRGCQGCGYCIDNGICCMDDYLKPMYDNIIESNAIIISSPIYFFDISAQVKNWIDRMRPMISKERTPRYPNKKVITVYAQGNSDKKFFEPAFQKMDNCLQLMFGWDVIHTLLCSGTAAPEYKISEHLLEEARQLGINLAIA